MRILTRAECQELDQSMKNHFQMSDELLMEAVASQCALLVFQKIRKRELKNVLVVCGPGNNGGDGLVIARHLQAMEMTPRVFAATGSSSEMLRRQQDRLQKLGIRIEPFETFLSLKDSSRQTLIIDSLFGVGLKRPLGEPFTAIIKKINELSGFKISIDVPSGLDVDKGVEFGDSVRADLTLTIGALKPGFFTAEGPLSAGKTRVVHGGFSEEFFPQSEERYFVRLPSEIRSWIPKRSKRSHKGSVGKCHLIAGSSSYLGAGKLTALGALASGASFVQIYGDSSLRDLLQDLPEVIFNGPIESVLDRIEEKDSVVIGPGVADSEEVGLLLKELVRRKKDKVILDAGAFAIMKSLQMKTPSTWVWTPHPGEMAELLDLGVREVEADRFSAVAKAQSRYGGQFLLKGFRPVFRTLEKDWWCLPYGDDRLGKAGTGDVLSGLIGGLMAQMEESSKAAALAVFVHAAAAKLITQGRNRHSLLTSELPSAIGRVLC